ncbi:PREDICTED: retrotransposon, partial [Prunus dulcis]
LVGDVCLEVDLIPLEMVGLDVILGMDWLAKHHASVDCFRKEVVFRSPGRPEVTFYGERRELKLEDIPVVREFLDVLPDDLPGVPPHREI